MTGALFWELMVVDLIVIFLCFDLPASLFTNLFTSNLFYLLLCVAAPFVWQIRRVAWWQCRLVQRLLWEAEDDEGKHWALTHISAPMCETEFYKGIPQLSPYVPVIENLCNCFLPLPIVERLLTAEPDQQTIREISPRRDIDAHFVEQHKSLIRQVLAFSNDYQTRDFRSRCLGWFRCPGGYLNPGSRMAVYRGKRPVLRVIVKHSEWYITDIGVKLLSEETLFSFQLNSNEERIDAAPKRR
jgi:hypothetical protein